VPLFTFLNPLKTNKSPNRQIGKSTNHQIT